MSAPDTPDSPARYWRDRIEAQIRGRRFVIAWDALAGATRYARRVESLGGEVFCLGANRGTGKLPEAPSYCFDQHVPGMMESLRAAEALFDDLPQPAVEALDAWDPERSARAIRPLFSAGAPIAGRPSLGARPAAWRALEDKLLIDALWDQLGIARAPSINLGVHDVAALRAAHRRLDGGMGTVWAGDNKLGSHGGASTIRWVFDEARDLDDARAFLADRCDRVRVMPFLSGVPCSIHGIVVPRAGQPSACLALRPCEMLVLRLPGNRGFAYAAAATFWDPPAEGRRQMRAAAQSVGRHLADTLGYRGVFTIDGVMTPDRGFLPTELNPRFGAAIGVLGRPLAAELPLYLLHLCLIEDAEGAIDWRPEALERLLIEQADRHRDGRAGRLSPVQRDALEEVRLVFEEGPDGLSAREAGPDEPFDADCFAGPASAGGYLGGNLVPERTPVGPSALPRVRAMLRYLDRRFGAQLGV